MLLTKGQKRRLDSCADDNESYHSLYDVLIEERLRELDPQFVKALERYTNKHGVVFWYS